jgi:hypothetical protein
MIANLSRFPIARPVIGEWVEILMKGREVLPNLKGI